MKINAYLAMLKLAIMTCIVIGQGIYYFVQPEGWASHPPTIVSLWIFWALLGLWVYDFLALFEIVRRNGQQGAS